MRILTNNEKTQLKQEFWNLPAMEVGSYDNLQQLFERYQQLITLYSLKIDPELVQIDYLGSLSLNIFNALRDKGLYAECLKFLQTLYYWPEDDSFLQLLDWNDYLDYKKLRVFYDSQLNLIQELRQLNQIQVNQILQKHELDFQFYYE